jgi:hypothetical protein
MKKTDSLLKKAEFFERLAVYGDRSNFLKSLAQLKNPEKGISYPGDIADQQAGAEKQLKSLVWQATQIFAQLNPENIPAPFNEIAGTKDWNAAIATLARVNLTPSNYNLTGLGPELKQLNSIREKMELLVGKSPSSSSAPTSEAPKAVDYPSIETNKQEALSRIITIEGLGLPLKIDGKMGPRTRAALDAFKKKIDPTLSDAGALRKALDMVKTDPKYKLREEF